MNWEFGTYLELIINLLFIHLNLLSDSVEGDLNQNHLVVVERMDVKVSLEHFGLFVTERLWWLRIGESSWCSEMSSLK